LSYPARSSLDDVVLVGATQLHLFLSIIALILLLRLFGVSTDTFDIALFSCVSMPATYALTYYHARIYRVGRFVTKKTSEPLRIWTYEVAALVTSYVMGYMVYVALSGISDVATYSIAFVVVQTMRIAIFFMARHLRALGVDIQHPAVVMLIALSTAVLALVGLTLLFAVLL